MKQPKNCSMSSRSTNMKRFAKEISTSIAGQLFLEVAAVRGRMIESMTD